MALRPCVRHMKARWRRITSTDRGTDRDAREARPVEIAERLGVKPPTVTKNISRLKAAGLVRREPYRAIFLTDAGQDLAEICRRRHRVVVAFLLSLGIDEETAERDAEGIEHHVSGTTLEAFERRLNQK